MDWEKGGHNFISSKTEYQKQCKYAKTEKGKLTSKKYHQSKKGKLAFTKYCCTEKGKLARRKTHIKSQAKRRRSLNWIQMFENPFDESEKVDWHHINNTYVVAIPRELHQLYYGKFHKEQVMEIVKQIYLRD